MLSNTKTELFKYPRTRHLFNVGGNGVSRDDLLLSKKEADVFIKNEYVIIEEKVDGANLGISINTDGTFNIQNRSHYVFHDTHRQFSVVNTWLAQHSETLTSILEAGKHIIFGEWLFAKHSIHYKNIKDYFMVFDIYDEVEKKFYSVEKRNKILDGTEIPCVRKIAEGKNFDKEKIVELLDTRSYFYNGYVEGLVIRKPQDETISKHAYFSERAKVVRPDFLQHIEEQWTRQKFTKNQLSFNSE